MKYKVGDKVRIKSIDWYNENKDEFDHIECGKDVFNKYMSKYCGQIATISDIVDEKYRLSKARSWDWTDEMFEED